MVNEVRGCKTPGCKGNLVSMHVHSQGLGGITCCCDGCAMNAVVLDTCVKNEKLCGNTNAVGMCVQIAFIIAGSTHAVYYKTLKYALGINAVCKNVFMDTIHVSCCKIDA